MKTGVIIINHGSRAKEANKVFDMIVEMINNRINYDQVRGAAMELTEPPLNETVKQMADKGVEKIIVIPLFLFPGVHIQRDIPELISQMEDKYPEIKIVLGDNIGAHHKIVDILEEKIREVE
jgi:sirohydrochlorin ferrochelatase